MVPFPETVRLFCVSVQGFTPCSGGTLGKLLDRSRRAYVVVEGAFYGPPLPDPKLPETVKKQYHPGWGDLAAFPTKLVVHRIDSVKAVGSRAQ